MTEHNTPKVSIVMGSKSDLPIMEKAADVLKELAIPFEIRISSAHRLPVQTSEFAKGAQSRGIEVIIAAAGMAAHLAGVIASYTSLPVIGVPIKSGELGGIDALLSTVQMPPGIPVAAVAINGAKNAAILAAQILSIKYPVIKTALDTYREKIKKEALDASILS
ncbi:phosphoribosylaminoimidazole carboxylase catalytic subunit [Candidatus Magnetoovum chiemensis]|nr:phosphoribosylaminoimidazole carboxylase catalytic subunit [Candidatus Magnetoovum chiemensis]